MKRFPISLRFNFAICITDTSVHFYFFNAWCIARLKYMYILYIYMYWGYCLYKTFYLLYLNLTLVCWWLLTLESRHMSSTTSQIHNNSSGFSTACPGYYGRKHQSSAIVARCEMKPPAVTSGSRYKLPIKQKTFPRHGIIWDYCMINK